VGALDASPERGGAACAALAGLMDLLSDTPGLRMLRILQPGLLCRAPAVLTAQAIGTLGAYGAGNWHAVAIDGSGTNKAWTIRPCAFSRIAT